MKKKKKKKKKIAGCGQTAVVFCGDLLDQKSKSALFPGPGEGCFSNK